MLWKTLSQRAIWVAHPFFNRSCDPIYINISDIRMSVISTKSSLKLSGYQNNWLSIARCCSCKWAARKKLLADAGSTQNRCMQLFLKTTICRSFLHKREWKFEIRKAVLKICWNSSLPCWNLSLPWKLTNEILRPESGLKFLCRLQRHATIRHSQKIRKEKFCYKSDLTLYSCVREVFDEWNTQNI